MHIINIISNRSGSEEKALVFDKQYYDAAHNKVWRPRLNPDQSTHDFTTGKQTDGINDRMMLKTDLCLTMDVRNVDAEPCCVTHSERGCRNQMSRCPMYPDLHPWMEAGTILFVA